MGVNPAEAGRGEDMKYHIKNKISRREIKKHGKKMIPLSLMRREDEIDRDRVDSDGVRTDNVCDKIVQGTEMLDN